MSEPTKNAAQWALEARRELLEHLAKCGTDRKAEGGTVMSEHLPECQQFQEVHRLWCICDLLWDAYDRGQADAFREAREAVAAIPKEDGGYCHVLHACDVEATLRELE